MSNDKFTIAVLIAKFAAKFAAQDKHAASASDKITSVEKRLDAVSKMPGPTGSAGEDGRNGANGRAGKPGETGANGINGKDGVDGEAGANGINGKDGAPGADGKDGDTGPMPKHEWRGTELRFQQSEKRWGKWVNLRGPSGLSSGGGGGATSSAAFDPSTLPPAAALPLPSEVLVLQDGEWTRATWAQFTGWVGSVAPVVTGTLLTEDGNNLAAEDGTLLQQE